MGRIDLLKQRFDYDDHDVDLIYSPKNVSRGKLQLTVRYSVDQDMSVS